MSVANDVSRWSPRLRRHGLVTDESTQKKYMYTREGSSNQCAKHKAKVLEIS